MNFRIIILLLILIQFECINAQKQNHTDQKFLSIKNESNSYLFKNDTIIQIIKISFLKDKLYYKYDVKNLKKNKLEHREGIAMKKKSINMELGENEAGDAYPVDQYENKNGNCWFIVSVEHDKKSMITILETKECSNKNLFNPINSLGILRKVKKEN